MHRGSLYPAILLCGLNAAFAGAAPNSPGPPAVVSVSVNAITGPDRNLAAALMETLTTDLARSPRITVVEGPTSAGARYRIMGSCVPLDNHVIINVRAVDATTGRTVPGAADNMLGPREKLLPLTEEIAMRLVQHLCYTPPTHIVAPPPTNIAARAVHLPAKAAHLPGRLTRVSVKPTRVAPMAVGPPVRRVASTVSAPPRPGLVAPANPMALGIRAIVPDAPAAPCIPAPEGGDDAAVIARGYTSVIVDARGYRVERSMSPQLRREDGSKLWSGGEASEDFAVDEGIVVYAHSLEEARTLDRAGSHPLIMRAVGRHDDAFRSDPLLADDDADYLMVQEKKDGYLSHNRVIFVVD